jgi:hypothetical protein
MMLSELVPFPHTHHAVMLTIPTTARREARFPIRCSSNERRDNRKSEDNQQQDRE